MFLILLAGFVLLFNDANSTQADGAIAASVRFEGEYRVGNGKWVPIVDGEHITSTKGDAVLKGKFYFMLEGQRVNDFAGRVLGLRGQVGFLSKMLDIRSLM